MKKLKFIACLCLGLVFLTGCGGPDYVCTGNNETVSIYGSKSVSALEKEQVFEFLSKSETDNQYNYYLDRIYPSQKDSFNGKIESSLNGKKYTVSFEYTEDEKNFEYLTTYLYDGDDNVRELVTKYENRGYECE